MKVYMWDSFQAHSFDLLTFIEFKFLFVTPFYSRRS
jgi:hypothetical protein